MPNSSARSFACAASGSQMATRRTRSPSLRQAVRWYQLIMPAPAKPILCGACRFAFAIVLTSMPGSLRLRAVAGDHPRRRRIEELDRRRVEQERRAVVRPQSRLAPDARNDLLLRAVECQDEQRLGAERLDRDDAHRDRYQPFVARPRRGFVEVFRADAEQDLAAAVAPERITRPAG